MYFDKGNASSPVNTLNFRGLEQPGKGSSGGIFKLSSGLAVPKSSRELGRVSNLNNRHMKGDVEIGHLTKHGAFRVNRDEAMSIGSKWFKIHTIVSNFETAPPKII